MSAIFLEVQPNGRVARMGNSGQVQSGLFQLATLSQSRTDSQGRTVWDTHEKSLGLVERNFDAAYREVRQDAQDILRRDDFVASLGMFQPRDLTHKFRQVLEERTPTLNAQRVYQISTEIPPGAMSYEQSRIYATGEAVVYRGGSGADIPVVGVGQATMTRPIVYLAAAADFNWLEQLKSNFAGIDTTPRKMRTLRRVIEELMNKWAFEGSEEHDIWGILNHPYVDTALSTVAWNDTTADPDDIAADAAVWLNYNDNVSGSTFMVDTWLIAPKLENYLRNRPFGDNRDKSLMDWILGANPHIKSVERIREFNDAGGAGIHANALTRRGGGLADTSTTLEVPLGATLLPADRQALATRMYMVAGYGGVNQREVGDNLVFYVQGPA